MPILAAYPVVDLPPQIDPVIAPQFQETRTFAFRSLDGQEILPFTGDEFIARWGIQGLDVPPRQIVEEAIPHRDGTEVTDIKIGSRNYTLPLFVGANSGHLQYLRNRALMRSFFNHRATDYRADGGSFDLVATSILGERTLRSFYIDGMNGQWNQETAGADWETFGITAVAPWPYWDGGRWTSEIIRKPGTAEAFFGFFPPKLAPNNLLNTTATVFIEGDVESYARVEAVGPATNVYLAADDFILDVPDGLADGETMVVDSDPRGKRILFGGVTDWSRLSPLTSLAPLLPGAQDVTLTMADPGTNTQVQISGTKWYETPW